MTNRLGVAEGFTRVISLRQLWIAHWLFILLVTLAPVSGAVPPVVSHGDKVAHFVLFAVLALLGGRVLWGRGGPMPAAGLVKWAVLYAVFGAAIEWLQPFFGRTCSLADWLADVAGVTVVSLWQSRKRG